MVLYSTGPLKLGLSSSQPPTLTLSVLSLVWSIVYVAGKGLMGYIHVQTIQKNDLPTYVYRHTALKGLIP